MDKRTTIIVDRNVVDFLHDRNVNVSRLCDKALYEAAIQYGFLDVEREITRLSLRLNRLKAINKTKVDKELRYNRFLMLFKGYLSTGTKGNDQIKSWLCSPANREFSAFIGRPQDLTVEKIQEFIAKAVTSPDLIEGE